MIQPSIPLRKTLRRGALYSLFLMIMSVLCLPTLGQGQDARPLIGLTTMLTQPEKGIGVEKIVLPMTYIHAVEAAGGIPLVLPPLGDENLVKRYVELLDGIVLVGGMDIPPECYGEVQHESVSPMAPRRFTFESRLIEHWLKTNKPILGVCLGIQFVNVLSGGTLIQDIPSQIGSVVAHRGEEPAFHEIAIEPHSRLCKILGQNTLIVNSNHHQAVDQIGSDLKVVARSHDGVIEAMEIEGGRFVLLLQWHPERMADQAHSGAIYQALIEASSESK